MSNSLEVWSLPHKEYNEKIIKLQENILSLIPRSEEWMMAIFQQWLHIANPHPWQIKHSLSLCNSQEVFITSRMGSRTSALTLAPVIARQVLRMPYIAIVVYPIEALMSDQVRFKRYCKGGITQHPSGNKGAHKRDPIYCNHFKHSIKYSHYYPM